MEGVAQDERDTNLSQDITESHAEYSTVLTAGSSARFTTNSGREAHPEPEESHHVPLTAYRLLVMSVIVIFGTAKALLSFKSRSVVPTSLEWILGCFFGVGFFWMSYYESLAPSSAPWLFQTDRTHEFRNVISVVICVTEYCLCLVLTHVSSSNIYSAFGFFASGSQKSKHQDAKFSTFYSFFFAKTLCTISTASLILLVLRIQRTSIHPKIPRQIISLRFAGYDIRLFAVPVLCISCGVFHTFILSKGEAYERLVLPFVYPAFRR